MARVRSSQRSCLLFLKFFLRLKFCYIKSTTTAVDITPIMYVSQTPQKTNNTRTVQGAGYNQLATTLYAPAARHQSRKQHHAYAVVCPRYSAVASYYVVAFLSDPAICKAGGGLCCCVINACCHRYNSAAAAAAAAVRLLRAAECGREFQPLVRCILSISVNTIPLLYTAVFRITRVCAMPCVTHGVLSNFFFFVGSPKFCAGEALFAVSVTTKTCINILINRIPQCLAESSTKSVETIQPIRTVSSQK